MSNHIESPYKTFLEIISIYSSLKWFQFFKLKNYLITNSLKLSTIKKRVSISLIKHFETRACSDINIQKFAKQLSWLWWSETNWTEWGIRRKKNSVSSQQKCSASENSSRLSSLVSLPCQAAKIKILVTTFCSLPFPLFFRRLTFVKAVWNP